jgi:hypothetical protein
LCAGTVVVADTLEMAIEIEGVGDHDVHRFMESTRFRALALIT